MPRHRSTEQSLGSSIDPLHVLMHPSAQVLDVWKDAACEMSLQVVLAPLTVARVYPSHHHSYRFSRAVCKHACPCSCASRRDRSVSCQISPSWRRRACSVAPRSRGVSLPPRALQSLHTLACALKGPRMGLLAGQGRGKTQGESKSARGAKSPVSTPCFWILCVCCRLWCSFMPHG